MLKSTATVKQCFSSSRLLHQSQIGVSSPSLKSIFSTSTPPTPCFPAAPNLNMLHNNRYHYSQFNNSVNQTNTSLFNRNSLYSSQSYFSTLNQSGTTTNNQNNTNSNNNNNNNNQNNNFKFIVPLLGAGFLIPLGFLAVEDDEVASPQPPNVDVQKIYASKTTSELIFSFFILKLCTFKIFSENGAAFIEFANKWGLSAPMNFIVKHTFFKHFCAGETIDETEKFTEKLNHQGIGTILDYSVEDRGGSAESFDHVASQIKKTITMASRFPDYSFSCVKVTGLTTPKLLERLNQIVNKKLQSLQASNHSQLPVDLIVSPTEIYKQAGLTEEEQTQLDQLVNRLDSIFAECHRSKVPILIDAEQTYYQAAIHHLAIAFSAKYNKERPLLYNTYQMYLVKGLNVLNDHMSLSKQLNFKLGAKIVRGAYMVTERKLAKENGYADPILPNIQETHHSYFTAMELLLKESANIGLMIASHNEQSVNYGIERIKQLNIDPKNPNIQFGQLFGMADFLSFNLVNHNQRVFKYVPYGPVEEVLPYLIRRMQENRGFIGSNSATELLFLKKEIKRRLFN